MAVDKENVAIAEIFEVHYELMLPKLMSDELVVLAHVCETLDAPLLTFLRLVEKGATHHAKIDLASA